MLVLGWSYEDTAEEHRTGLKGQSFWLSCFINPMVPFFIDEVRRPLPRIV